MPLQRSQHSALRVTIGPMLLNATDQLRQETKILLASFVNQQHQSRISGRDKNKERNSHQNSPKNSWLQTKVLLHPPPEIAKGKSLPRRNYLSQLQSRYSPLLKSYTHRITSVHPLMECPKCEKVEQETQHLFESSAQPTALSPKPLWIEPIVTATSLVLPIGNKTNSVLWRDVA